MVTASHNPAKYNGYKAYGPDGCQMTDDAAAIVYDEIQKTDDPHRSKVHLLLQRGSSRASSALWATTARTPSTLPSRHVRCARACCRTAGLKLVYSPLNGSGLVPVTHVLNDMGVTDITIVPEQVHAQRLLHHLLLPQP